MDRYRLCETCPKRDMADLMDALGESAKAEAIREAGCSRWRDLQAFHEVGGFAAETYQGCLDDWLPRAIIVVWHAAVHSAAAFNDARNHVLANLEDNGADSLRDLIGLGLTSLAGGSNKQIGRGDDPSPEMIDSEDLEEP